MVKNLPNERNNHSEHATRLIIKAVIPLSLLFGGLWLLTLKLAGWSIIFGLPMIVMGVVFLIYSYDEVVSGKIQTHVDMGKDEDINY